MEVPWKKLESGLCLPVRRTVRGFDGGEGSRAGSFSPRDHQRDMSAALALFAVWSWEALR